ARRPDGPDHLGADRGQPAAALLVDAGPGRAVDVRRSGGLDRAGRGGLPRRDPRGLALRPPRRARRAALHRARRAERAPHVNPTCGIVAVSLVAIATLAIGVFGLRFSRTTSDFYVASRSVTPALNGSAISGEYLSAASFLGVAGLVLTHGA